MITENDIIEILKDKNLFKHKTWGNWRKAIAKAIIDKMPDDFEIIANGEVDKDSYYSETLVTIGGKNINEFLFHRYKGKNIEIGIKEIK